MNASDNLAALIYLKNKVHKWKNVAIIFASISLLLFLRFISGGSLSDSLPEGSYIADIKIEGVIFEDEYRSKILEEVAKEDSVKALIVNIDSPGGGIVGSENLIQWLIVSLMNQFKIVTSFLLI